MQRTVISPANLSGQALSDLKDWLGITRPNEDSLLITLIETSLAMCEAFIGQAPIEQTVEEIVPNWSGSVAIKVRPVRTLVSVEAIIDDGSRGAIDPSEIEIDINAEGQACLQVSTAADAKRLAVTMNAGIANDWASLPRPLKQGMIRLAAFNYRDRENTRSANPPASVAALWRPWRVLRVA